MRVVLTGANGNLGKHIQDNAKFEILPVTRTNWEIFENISVSSYQAIIHTAYDLKNSIFEQPDMVLESNIVTTGKALKLCLEKKIAKFIFISSCSVYGDSSNSAEDKPCYPVTMNGFTKLFNEELVKSFCKANKIEYLILRVFNSYGGDDNFSVVQKLIKCAQNKQPFTLINEGSAERDFIHINDAARIVCALTEINLSHEIINIGSGTSVKIYDILKAVESIYGPINVIKKQNPAEAVYSRANIKKLNNFIEYNGISIFDYFKSLK
jgi:UDP-glucose 4-epimerase